MQALAVGKGLSHKKLLGTGIESIILHTAAFGNLLSEAAERPERFMTTYQVFGSGASAPHLLAIAARHCSTYSNHSTASSSSITWLTSISSSGTPTNAPSFSMNTSRMSSPCCNRLSIPSGSTLRPPW